MDTSDARSFLIEQLTPRYGPGEAAAIARIVLEDVFGVEGLPAEASAKAGGGFTRRSPGEGGWTATEVEQLKNITARLISGEPVQYVLGQADFFGLKFKVNPAVLIPRQETEELVAWVLEHLKNSRIEHPAVLDIGLGSGCIGITLKKKFPDLQLFGLEKSPAALTVATENALRILGEGAAFRFIEGDIFNYPVWAIFPLLDVVVSNPPYIPNVEKSIMPEHVTAHEPALALFVDDADPLAFYRVIADFSLQKLKPCGALFFECNEFNAGEVAALLQEKGFVRVELRKDLAGAERMVCGMVARH